MSDPRITSPSDPGKAMAFLQGLQDDRDEGIKRALAVNAMVFATMLGIHALKNRGR